MKNMPSPDVLVLDGHTKTSLGVVRSLSKKGLSIVVGSKNSLGRANFSRGIKGYFTYTEDDEEREKAHATILEPISKKTK